MSEYRQLLMFTLSIKGPSTLCALSKLCIVGRIKKLFCHNSKSRWREGGALASLVQRLQPLPSYEIDDSPISYVAEYLVLQS